MEITKNKLKKIILEQLEQYQNFWTQYAPGSEGFGVEEQDIYYDPRVDFPLDYKVMGKSRPARASEIARFYGSDAPGLDLAGFEPLHPFERRLRRADQDNRRNYFFAGPDRHALATEYYTPGPVDYNVGYTPMYPRDAYEMIHGIPRTEQEEDHYRSLQENNKLKKIIAEELQAVLKEASYQEMVAQINSLITNEHVDWWMANGGKVIDEIKKSAYDQPGSYGKSHTVPLRFVAKPKWEEFYNEFPDLRAAAAEVDPSNQFAGATIVGAIATEIKRRVSPEQVG